MLPEILNDSTAYRYDGTALVLFVCAGLNFRVVIPPQANECDPLQTDIAIFRRPAQPSNSLASITDVALQSIFQHLDVASAARLASTCKVCFDEHRHQYADIYERAYRHLTPEVTITFVPPWRWDPLGVEDPPGVEITVHWADEEALLQMYRIAFHRKALPGFWSSLWPANLHELIWTAAMNVGEHDKLADCCKDHSQIALSIWIHVVISCTKWTSPLPDAWADDGYLDEAAVDSLGSALEHAQVSLSVAQQAVDTTGGLLEFYSELFYHQDAHIYSDADASDYEYRAWVEAHAVLAPDPEVVWDSSLDWMHEVPSGTNSYVQQDQIFACEPVGQLRRREYTHRVFAVRNRKCHTNRQADNRIKQPRKRLDKHVTGKHKRVGLVQWELMLDCDVFM